MKENNFIYSKHVFLPASKVLTSQNFNLQISRSNFAKMICVTTMFSFSGVELVLIFMLLVISP